MHGQIVFTAERHCLSIHKTDAAVIPGNVVRHEIYDDL